MSNTPKSEMTCRLQTQGLIGGVGCMKIFTTKNKICTLTFWKDKHVFVSNIRKNCVPGKIQSSKIKIKI
jgi:hypothetical protein